MEKNQKNIFGSNQLDLDNSLIIQVWNNDNMDMTEDDFKEIMIEYVELIVKNKIKKALVNAQKMNYSIVPELQDWINKEVAPYALPYTQKVAFVMPSDFFTQVSIQQSMEDAKNVNEHNTQYFESIEDAKTWLLS